MQCRKENRNETKKGTLRAGLISLILFGLWTALFQFVDVQSIGPKGTNIGFSTFNSWFHNLTGVNMTIYNITDRILCTFFKE